MKTVKLEYLGTSAKKPPRTFLLPIPFSAYSEKTGEVVCDPVGEFPEEDAERLLALAPEVFRRVEAEPEANGAGGDGCTESAPEAPRYRGRQNAINWRDRHEPTWEIVKSLDGFFDIVPPRPPRTTGPEDRPTDEWRSEEK